MSKIFFILVMVMATWIGAFGAYYLKLGSTKFSLDPFKLVRNHKFVIGATLYFLSVPLYLFVLSNLPLSVTHPMTSMTYIWSAFLSKRFLNERVDLWRWGGICAIIVGISLLSL